MPAEPAPISLLIPIRNNEPFLPKLLAEIRNQTRPFAEVIFADGNSSDRSVELVEAAGFRVLRGAARGPGPARNDLLAASACPWVHFHDSDDRIHLNFVEVFAAALPPIAGNDAWFCASWRYRPEHNWEEETRYRGLGPDVDWIRYHLSGFIHHNQIVFPRAALMAAKGYNETLKNGEDVNLHIRLAAAGMKFHYIDEVLVEQLCGRPGGLTSQSVTLRVHESTLASCEQIAPLLPEKYRRDNVPMLADLAVIFGSAGMRPEMERALRLAQQSAPDRKPLPTRPGLRQLSRVLGLPLVLRSRLILLAALKRLGVRRP